MTSFRAPNTGRRADEDEREIARQWLNLYLSAQATASGELCLNPEDPLVEQTWINGNDPMPLLSLLKNFSENGTFKNVGEKFDSIRLLVLRSEYKKMRASRKTYESTTNELADTYHTSLSTIQRLVRNVKS